MVRIKREKSLGLGLLQASEAIRVVPVEAQALLHPFLLL